MKKNILIAVLLVITVLSLVYAFVQRAEAETQRRIAEENTERAEQAFKMAEAERQKMEDMLEIATRAAERAQAEMEKGTKWTNVLREVSR